jgi:hypothetical protein
VEDGFTPRRLDFTALVGVLVEEHSMMRKGLDEVKELARRRDFEGVRRVLDELDPVFRQHIADEEAQILGLLIDKLGVKGAESEILVFRQHRPIYQLMKKLDELAAMSSVDLEKNQVDLQRLFDEHAIAEESRVFPRAMSVRSQEDLRKNGR